MNNKEGKVVWITGLPGAGKTTLANCVRKTLVCKSNNPILLDGDEIRAVLGQLENFDKSSRLNLAKKYGKLANLFANQGHLVLVSTVSLFHDVHKWNRENIRKYVEVFIDTPIDILRKRDQKGLYSSNQKNIPGINLTAEFPAKPDLVLNQTGQESVETMTTRILKKLNELDKSE